MRIGADPFPPYQYLDGEERACGSDFERVSALFAKAGFDFEIEIDSWDAVLARFEAGELDALFQVQKSPEREERYFFSRLLRNAVTEVVASDAAFEAAERFSSFDALADSSLSLGVLAGYAYGEEVDRLPASCKVPFASTEGLLRALGGHGEGEGSAARIDVAIVDRGVKDYLCATLGIPAPRVIEGLRFERPLYIMFRDRALCDAVSACQEPKE